MRIRREPAIEIKTAAQLAAMAEAGRVVARALNAAAAAVAPGVSTAALDAIAAREIRAAGAAPSFLGYHGFPATRSCTGSRGPPGGSGTGTWCRSTAGRSSTAGTPTPP
jgi:methionyl aminopeptidase